MEVAKNEIFIRNLNFSTTEEKLKAHFANIIPENEIQFCLIVKNKTTNESKGSAFLKLKTQTAYEKIMKMYKDTSDINAFELDGRNMKLFTALNRESVNEIKEKKNNNDNKRKKHLLYYGLSDDTISHFPLYEEITDTDKAKRERIIEIKKNNFFANPNYHVSDTRLSLRNFDKSVNENDIKSAMIETVNKNEEIKAKYKNIKMFKQIKLLREDDDKSKCVAFVECANEHLAKFIISQMSGMKLKPKSKKGLIIDFALDDFRKRAQRERKLERIKQMRKERKKAKSEDIAKNKETEKIEVAKCEDIDKLIDCYRMTLSRGKKQRIKKRLKSLGYTKDIPALEVKKEEKENELNEEQYEQIKISNNKTEMNKKFKEKMKEKKKDKDNNTKDKKMLNKKRNRKDKNANANMKNYYEDDEEEKKNKKANKRNKKETKLAKEHIRNKSNEFSNEDDDDDDDDMNMNEYYTKIMKNLNK